MNKRTLPTKQSVTAVLNFSYWLCNQMEARNVTATALASYCGLERKTIYSYCSGERYPKLDVLAKIFSFFDYDEINIPLEVDNDSVFGT